ncbi:hypothetical protein JB92DRAFT_2827332 [Gautieria morchelliformis]|nr:hypothetical protein JB92DRAFT_2827332 [Gautieria morchelliformis]
MPWDWVQVEQLGQATICAYQFSRMVQGAMHTRSWGYASQGDPLAGACVCPTPSSIHRELIRLLLHLPAHERVAPSQDRRYLLPALRNDRSGRKGSTRRQIPIDHRSAPAPSYKEKGRSDEMTSPGIEEDRARDTWPPCAGQKLPENAEDRSSSAQATPQGTHQLMKQKPNHHHCFYYRPPAAPGAALPTIRQDIDSTDIATLAWLTVHRARRDSGAVEGNEGSGGGTYKPRESRRMILIEESTHRAQLSCVGRMPQGGGCALNREKNIRDQDALERVDDAGSHPEQASCSEESLTLSPPSMTLACPAEDSTEHLPPSGAGRYRNLETCVKTHEGMHHKGKHLNRPLHTRLELDVTKENPNKTRIAKGTQRGTQGTCKMDHGEKEGNERNTKSNTNENLPQGMHTPGSLPSFVSQLTTRGSTYKSPI